VQYNDFSSLWDYCCKAKGWGEFNTLTPNEQDKIRSESNKRLLAYLLLVNSSNTSTHESVKNNLLEAFIARRDEYLESRSDAILNKYDERKPPPTAAASEGTAFAQKGQKGKKKTDEKIKKDDRNDEKSKSTDKDFWKDKECFICNKKGHPAAKCPLKKINLIY
jgi:hypothetical protein